MAVFIFTGFNVFTSCSSDKQPENHDQAMGSTEIQVGDTIEVLNPDDSTISTKVVTEIRDSSHN
jgi:hypothetical protein